MFRGNFRTRLRIEYLLASDIMVCWGKRLTEYQIPLCEDTGTELVLLLILFLLNVLFSDELQTLKLEVSLFYF